MSEPAPTALQWATVLVLEAYEQASRVLTLRQRRVLRDILLTRVARDIVAEELEHDREEEAA